MTPTPPNRTASSDEARPYNRGWIRPSLQRDRERLLRFQYPAEHAAAWDEIRHEVWAYAAVRVLPAIIRDGRVWTQYRALRHVSLKSVGRGIAPDRLESQDLAIEVTTRCIPIFYDQLKRGRWDPTKETTMATWFVNLCVLVFPRVWKAAIEERVKAEALVEIDVDFGHAASDAPDAVIYEIEFDRQLDFFDPCVQVMVQLDRDGFSDAEIADLVNELGLLDRPLTRKAVERRLERARTAARRRERMTGRTSPNNREMSGGKLAAGA